MFPNREAFERTRKELEQRSHRREAEVNAWEEGLNFVSLRTAAISERFQLEKSQREHRLSPAYELMERFGFPEYYAVLISPAGEYQIENTIYWFHNGFKYAAASEEELNAIKHAPQLAKMKYAAGAQHITNQVAAGKTANRTYQTNYPYAYDKYTFQFQYQYDPKSLRRIIYATSVYSEDFGTDYGPIPTTGIVPSTC